MSRFGRQWPHDPARRPGPGSAFGDVGEGVLHIPSGGTVSESVRFAKRWPHAFLERASADEEGFTDLLGFGALFVLGVVDSARQKERDVAGVLRRIDCAEDLLNDAAQVQEQWFLRAILRACADHVRHANQRVDVFRVLKNYAEWLRSEGRDEEVADVEWIASDWNAV